MCGLTGFWQPPADARDVMLATAQRMADTLAHRGPDDHGEWADERAGIAFGHRRLSIVDLSPEGHQPMRSASGRYVIAFNGEIYNYPALRAELERDGAAPGWRGHSDTEVLLAAFEHWGLELTVRRCVGMFALVLWDTRERVLHLARDRMGEKPLYYGWMGAAFLFGSELKALQAHPAFRPVIDRDAVALYMRYACVPAPYSIFAGVSKLLPGTLLSFSYRELESRARARPKPYWTLEAAASDGARALCRGPVTDAVDQLDAVLREAVAGQMVADVPLGAFLSGGVDSSTVVALMQAQSGRPVRTFSIGFAEQDYDEAVYAKSVARHLGTDHTELYVSAEDALAVVPGLPSMYDEPFADSSQIPTFLVSRLAKQHVTVSLSGDGGDELFGGYNRHRWGRTLRRTLGWAPAPLRTLLAQGITRFSPAALDAAFARSSRVLPRSLRFKAAGDKLHKLAGLIGAESDELLYQRMVSLWPDAVALRDAVYPVPLGWIAYGTPAALRSLPERMMYLDSLGYLPDDILAKVDRAAMHVSLETRVPMLDHRVVEFAWRLPLELKLRGGRGKWLLREVLHRYVPRELIERPKMGFSIPLDGWLRGPLRDWAAALLDPGRLAREGFLDPEPITAKWREHSNGTRNWQHALWVVLMFEAWLEQQHGKGGA